MVHILQIVKDTQNLSVTFEMCECYVNMTLGQLICLTVRSCDGWTNPGEVLNIYTIQDT